ncbi:MAG: hypothetical protein D6160_17040 [Ketobacter sp.]|nr:MAG: hypothetical protein D6160_17040 [Ketobacter sp.]
MLLKTKLFAPPLRQNAVPRVRLLELLGAPAQGELTLIHAPAGYGKTTLALQWLQSIGQPYVWLSLDSQDNDSLRFWRYVSGTLAGGNETRFAPAQTDSDPEAWVVSIVNHWTGQDQVTTLVLDDFHVIQDPALLQTVNWFLDNLPPSLHVLITTRVLPSLHIPLRRVRSHITEIQAFDLSFGRTEVQRFFQETLKLTLNIGMLDALQARTEGWAAALQLAGLTLKQHPRQSTEWLEQESSTLLVDYLAEEVLSNLPQTTRQFMLSMATARRFNLSLCEALNPDKNSKEVAVLLDALREDNLFLIPLDDQGHWFRFHDLFRENLLNITSDRHPQEWLLWNRRAADWFVSNDEREEAIHCLLAASLWDEAAGLIEQLGVTRMLGGQNESLNWWLSRLPAGTILQRPKLALIKAWSLFCTERIVEAEPYLDQADRLLAQEHPDHGPLRTQIAIFRTQLARVRGEDELAHHWSGRARTLAAESDVQLNAVAQFALGMELYQEGDHPSTQQLMELAMASARQERNHFCVLSCSVILSHVLFQQGFTVKALNQLQDARDWLIGEGLDPHYLACWQNTAYVHIYCEINQIERATEALEVLLEFRDSGAEAAYGALILMLQASLEVPAKDFSKAIRILDSAAPVMERDRSYWSKMGPSVSMMRALYCLQSNQIQSALLWAAERENALLQHFGFLQEEDRIVLARCLALQNRKAEAVDLLLRIEADTEAHGRIINLVRAKVARALVLAAEEPDLAADCLLQAITISEAPGYRRLFLDEGAALIPLLRILVKEGKRGWWEVALIAKGRPASSKGLVEPLTSREQEVLDLIAQGLSNQSIADHLHIAIATTKAHLRNIYEKLAVSSRTQAVAKARELGLLE